ncbi:hypothetical protein Tco_0900233 [Tanacetum coccineum]
MLTKPQFFYDHTTKQALGFQNPFDLNKAQQLEPKLYVGDIIKKTNPIVISDSEETLILSEESRSKMLLKQQDPMMLEKKVNTTPIDYAVLNQLSQDFKTRFVLQTELSAEQDFWSKNDVNSPEPTLSNRPTKVEVPKELPKVSMDHSLRQYKKDKIWKHQSSIKKNKVESHPRESKSRLKNKDCVVESKGTAHVQHSRLNANSELKCVKCNGCMLSANHDLCVLDFINNVNARNKSKSVKKNSKKKDWKPTGKVFTKIRYIWRPTGRTFTIVGKVCPLTRITTTTEVPLRKPTALENETPKPVVTLVYLRKPRKSKTNIPDSKSKAPKFVSANKKEPSQSRGSKVSNVPSSSLNEF